MLARVSDAHIIGRARICDNMAYGYKKRRKTGRKPRKIVYF